MQKELCILFYKYIVAQGGDKINRKCEKVKIFVTEKVSFIGLYGKTCGSLPHAARLFKFSSQRNHHVGWRDCLLRKQGVRPLHSPHRPTVYPLVRRIYQLKAPSGRGLPTTSGGGECVNGISVSGRNLVDSVGATLCGRPKTCGYRNHVQDILSRHLTWFKFLCEET